MAIIGAALFVLLNLSSAHMARHIAGGPAGPLGAARNALTARLSQCFVVAGTCLVLGVVDRLAWQLAFDGFSTVNVGLALGAAAVALRAAAPAMATGGQSAPPWLRSTGSVLLQALGYLLSALLLVWWTALVMKVVFGAVFPITGIGASPGGRALTQPDFGAGWLQLLLVMLPVAAYALCTGRNVQFLNLSSLHTFYAARLTRAYLGAANGRRFSMNTSALDPIDGALRTDTPDHSVGEVHPDDDTPLQQYAPHRAGGPVHLINTCVNQSAAARGRLFNRDRKGLPLCVMAGGASQLGQEGWKRMPGIGTMSLGSWLAISGAAVAPGLGARTQRGLSALLTFAGVRLGYWLTREARDHEATPRPWWRPRLDKSAGLLAETAGTFEAAGKNDWLVSDGGHFENTAAYALLAARAQFILVADCGADPDYAFADLENLVRKARIDLDTRIVFHKPVTKPSVWARTLSFFGSLNELASPHGCACLSLATVHYPALPGGAAPPPAVLIVIKPNMCAGLPMDVENYRQQCPAFPQSRPATSSSAKRSGKATFRWAAFWLTS
ncbi:hypothetical protein [uncultured Pseudacidovorax sp.]|uniref:hypothetical protein n=1 Tax=uncultured Pseudacidovorax sp. TaxID=679313 RepID=UPI0025EAA1E2|nr:hypothetical protein [uncultured Pseudacidovorax sp.]